MDFTDWMCPDCYIVMQSYAEGEAEECPKCGGPMEEAFVTEDG